MVRAAITAAEGVDLSTGAHTSSNLRLGGGGRANQPSLPDAVVASSAVPRSNPELLAARALGVPVLGRDEWLSLVTRDHALLAVAGTHGKTTTSAMLTVALRASDKRVAAVVGGEVPQLPGGTNAVVDRGHERGDPFVLEADEYDGAFLLLEPLVAVVTNIEWDHVDIYAAEEECVDAFRAFASRVRPGGALLVCGDSAPASQLVGRAQRAGEAEVEVRTFGTTEESDYRAVDLETNAAGGTDFRMFFRDVQLCTVSLPAPGVHNVRNAAAAVAAAALAEELSGGDPERAAARAAAALCTFEGVGRRFEVIGEVPGVCTIVDDYAHHPTEIAATLQGARQRYVSRPLWVVFQPHTHARLAAFRDGFVSALAAADRTVVAPVFEARGEDPEALGAVPPRELTNLIADAGTPAVEMSSLDEVVDRLTFELSSGVGAGESNEGVVILTLGAGDITSVGRRLLGRLQV